jgi:phosphatidylinositol 4-kinase
MDILTTWLNPLGNPELTLPAETTINTWRQMKLTEKTWRDSVSLAWDISPTLAIYLPWRLKSADSTSIVNEELSKLVRLFPAAVMHVPAAVTFLANSDAVLNDSPEVSHLSVRVFRI